MASLIDEKAVCVLEQQRTVLIIIHNPVFYIHIPLHALYLEC